MLNRVTPPIGVNGKFVLEQPWNAKNDTNYRCIALRRVEELVKQNISLYDSVYAPMGLSQDVCNGDITAGVVIVSLLGSDGSRIYVPDTYIKSFPDQSAVTLDYVVLSVDLGPQPSNLNLDNCMNEIKAVASKFTGIEVNDINVGVGYAQSSNTLTQEETVRLDTIRTNKIKNLKTKDQRITELEKIVQDQNALLTNLTKK